MFQVIKLACLFLFFNCFLVRPIESFDESELNINWSVLAHDTENKIESHEKSKPISPFI